jgi:hypothetical protein
LNSVSLLIPERPPNIDEKLDTTTSLTRRAGKLKNWKGFFETELRASAESKRYMCSIKPIQFG